MAGEQGDRGFEEDGFYWDGTREELEAWKKYKQRKALAFVERGYLVSWFPDPDAWMDVYTPERDLIKVPEYHASVKFYADPSPLGIEGGRISKLSISSRQTNLIAKIVRGAFDHVELFYNYDRGPDVNRLGASEQPAACTTSFWRS